jgi:Fic family protein
MVYTYIVAIPETLRSFQPLVIPSGKQRENLLDLAADVTVRAGHLSSGISSPLGKQLRRLTAVINTYASNLIEGHDTRPLEILRAMRQHEELGNVDNDALMRGALASAQLQIKIDEAPENDREGLFDPELLSSLHKMLFVKAPELLEVKDRGYWALAGMLRGSGMDVQVGEHVPPLGVNVDELTKSVFAYYRKQEGLSGARLIDAAAMHHRLLYLHPFAEGNGRTIRVYTHALVRDAGAGGGGLWSISRGLSRGLANWPGDPKGQYKSLLAGADMERQGDTTDGRGALSLKALVTFVKWFLLVAIDQIDYMAEVYDLPRLRFRSQAVWAATLSDKPRVFEQALPILRRLFEGELSRKEAWDLVGKSPRTGRAVVTRLLDEGLIFSDSDRGPVHLMLAFPGLLPGLF